MGEPNARVQKRQLQNWIALLVDDNPDNLRVTYTTLKMHGVQVYTAANGLEAMQLLDTIRPTFILLDLSMPIMSGWETIEAVRASPRTANIPVIALTAHAMKGDYERILATGFDGYIAKPFGIKTLVDDIEVWLKTSLKDAYRP